MVIETALAVLTALAFGLGATFSILGLLLLYQIFVQGRNFNSWFIIMQVSISLSTVGFALLYLVLN
jgi:hypothetical protein